jgi:hypothetical protein
MSAASAWSRAHLSPGADWAGPLATTCLCYARASRAPAVALTYGPGLPVTTCTPKPVSSLASAWGHFVRAFLSATTDSCGIAARAATVWAEISAGASATNRPHLGYKGRHLCRACGRPPFRHEPCPIGVATVRHYERNLPPVVSLCANAPSPSNRPSEAPGRGQAVCTRGVNREPSERGEFLIGQLGTPPPRTSSRAAPS